jgi:YidC/Oxa1 family membrane protein insertase
MAGERRGLALEQETSGGWAGFTDKYWLTAINPVDDAQPLRATGAMSPTAGRTAGRWTSRRPRRRPWRPARPPMSRTRVFAGAKEVRLLDRYTRQPGITNFDKAIDFGMFYFLTKPFFYALDWLYKHIGNFGIAILIFTVALKALFFPLASKAYKSMARMKHARARR